MTTDLTSSEDNPPMLDPHPDDVAAATPAAPVVLEEEFEMPRFKLIVGQEYVLACKLHMKVLCESKGLFLGIIEQPLTKAFTQWYLPGGETERDLDAEPEQDPFDVVRVHREAHTIFLLRDNLTLAYQHNNCFFDRDTAVKAAQIRKLQIVAFKEVMDD